MKRALRIALAGIGIVVSLCLLEYGIVKLRLQRLSSITHETGLVLPSSTRIIATKPMRYSLADGANFEWLIVTEEPLTDWLQGNMKLEVGGWGNITQLSEACPMADGDIGKLPLDSVWRSARHVTPSKWETAYVYVAQGRRAAVVTTFRP